MVSLHREKKLAIRRGIDRKQVDKCETNAELSKLVLKQIKQNQKDDNQKENNES